MHDEMFASRCEHYMHVVGCIFLIYRVILFYFILLWNYEVAIMFFGLGLVFP